MRYPIAAVNFILPKWLAAKAAQQAGTRNAVILVLSDSTGAGFSTITNNSWSDGVAACWPTKLAQTASGGSWQSWIGANATSDANYDQGSGYDPRRPRPTNWHLATTGIDQLGKRGFQCDSPNTDTFAFTPTTNVDTFVLIYQKTVGFGSFDYNVDGGATIGTIDCNAAAGYGQVVIPAGASGAHTLNVQRAAGGSVILSGCYAYDSAVKEITILNASWGGAAARGFTNSNSDAVLGCRDMIRFIAPDLTIIDLTINDSVPVYNLATYGARDLQQLHDAGSQSGDVFFMSGTPVNPAVVAVSDQYAVIGECSRIARVNRRPMLNMNVQWVSFAAANANGWMAADGVHITALGESQIPAPVMSRLAL